MLYGTRKHHPIQLLKAGIVIVHVFYIINTLVLHYNCVEEYTSKTWKVQAKEFQFAKHNNAPCLNAVHC